ncbi:hypothetical protein Tco_0068870 [Tanacetum coccineum]
MGVIMELHEGECYWPATKEVVEEGGGDNEEGDGEGGNKGVGGSADIYRNMSQGDWQVRQARWMDQQDEHWGMINAWNGQQDERAHWIYMITPFASSSTCRLVTTLSHTSRLIHFLGSNQGQMPPGYTYRPYLPQDGFS